MDQERENKTPEPEAEPVRPTVPEKPPAPLPKERTSGLAVASMVLGIVGFLPCPLIASLLALIFGLIAKGEIKKGKGAVGGSGMATAGIVMGCVELAILVILAAVVIPIGVVVIRPEIKATTKLLDGAAAARIYYFENGDSYRGVRDTDLAKIDDSIDFRMAPGRTANVVYIDRVTDRTVRLYCYSSSGRRYLATARGDEWRFGFRFWNGRLRWLDDTEHHRLFE